MSKDFRTGDIRADTFDQLIEAMRGWLEVELIERYSMFDHVDVDIMACEMAEAAYRQVVKG